MEGEKEKEIRAELAELRLHLRADEDDRAKKPNSEKPASPLTPLILGGIGTAILALVNNFSQWYSTHALEQDKLRSTLILKAVEAPSAEERKKALVFFVQSGLISDRATR